MFAACKKSPETSILLSLVTWFISKEDKYKAATYLVVIRDTIHSTRFELHEDVVVILEWVEVGCGASRSPLYQFEKQSESLHVHAHYTYPRVHVWE